MANEVWGIDIGRSAVKAVKMRRMKDVVEVVGVEMIPYEKSSEETDKDEQVRQALLEFKTRAKLKGERVFVSIPGQATFNRMITIAALDPKRIPDLVAYEAQQQIPFPIDEVLWDFQLIADENKGSGGGEREVMLFAVRKEIITNFLANLGAVQIPISGIQISPLAIYNFMRYTRPELQNTIAIDIGAENTDLVIIHGEKLWIRALPAAGDDITKAIQKKFTVPYDEAESLKIKSGQGKQAKKIFDVIKPVLKDLVSEINRSVGYFKSMVSDIKFDKMVFMGNSSKLSGFDQFFSQSLQYEIEILSEVQKIRVASQLNPDNVNLFQANIGSFAVAIGLGVQALKLAANNIKLIPKEIERTEKEKESRPWFIAAVALLFIIPIFLWWNNKSTVQELQKHEKNLKPMVAQIENIQKQLDAVGIAEYEAIAGRLEEYSKIGRGRYSWLEILNNINRVFNLSSEQIESRQKKEEAENKLKKESSPSRNPKMWVLDLNMRETQREKTVAENQTEKLPCIQVNLKVRFKSLETPIDNLEYATQFLRQPLENCMRKQQPLFERAFTIINPELRDDPSDDQKYCEVSLTLFSWMES